MRALITGALDQDGTLLAARLAREGIEVLGICRPDTPVCSQRAPDTRPMMLTDVAAMRRLLDDFAPDHVYHLAACHHSSEGKGASRLEHEMVQTNFLAVQVLLDAIAERRLNCRLLVAGSSQMYRPVDGTTRVIDEGTETEPATFYGRTKAWSRELVQHYRERHGVHAMMAIQFNHESELRNTAFVTRKITYAAARASLGLPVTLHLRDIASATDWSSAHDVVDAMFLALSSPTTNDFVIASGAAHRVEDVLAVAFGHVNLPWRDFASFDTPTVGRAVLVGDSALARTNLGWSPKWTFDAMIVSMVEADVAQLNSAAPP